MGGFVFRAMWPIEDLDRPISALVAEACRELDSLAFKAGGRICGEPSWTVAGETLICEVPAAELGNVIPMPRKATYRGARLPDHVLVDMQILVERGWSVKRIAAHLGTSEKTVRRYQAGDAA